MVRAGREQLRLVGVGVELEHPLGHELGVRELLRTPRATHHDRVGIVGVRRVDGGDRLLEPSSPAAHFGRRSIVSVRMPLSSDAAASPMMAKSW